STLKPALLGGLVRSWYCVLRVMPATPPVGNGLSNEVETVAVWPLLKRFRPCVGWSVAFQVALLFQIASNLESERSMLAPVMAGSRENARMLSEPPKPRMVTPFTVARISLANARLVGFCKPTVPL